RNGARAIRRGRGHDRVELGHVRSRGAGDRGQPVESRIGQHTRVDARFSSTPDGAVEREDDEGRSAAAGGPQADEESGRQPSVLLGRLRAGGRRQVIYASIPFSRRASHFIYLLLRYDSTASRTATTAK